MKVEFLFTWCEAWQKELKIPKGYLVIKPKGPNIKNLGGWLTKLTSKQSEKDIQRDCEAHFEVHYKKRTQDMNKLSWALYDIEATEQNGGRKLKDMSPNDREAAVTPSELYEADIKEYAPVIEQKFPVCQIDFIRDMYSHIISEVMLDKDTIEVKAFFSTSHMNTKEHSVWIERQFARLSEQGVHLGNASAVGQYWVDYAAAREPDTENWYTSEEYKIKQPFCEAEPTMYLGNGGGSLAHIVARGMGRNPMEGKYHEADVMHLSDASHALFDNGKGRQFFLLKYPHLKKKIEAALKKQIDTSQTELFDKEVKQETPDERNNIPLM